MYRLLPGRWLGLFLVIPVFALAGLAVSTRFGVLKDVFVEGRTGAITGLIVGVVAIACINLFQAPHDTRLLRLGEMFPDALVENVHLDSANQLVVRHAASQLSDSPRIASGASLLFDRDAIVIYVGSLTPDRVLTIPWSDVTRFRVEGPDSKSRWSGQSQTARLEIAVQRGDAALRLDVPVARRPDGALPRPFLAEGEVGELVGKAIAIRNIAATPTAALSGAGSLVPGPSAWRLSQFVRPVAVGVAIAVVLVPLIALIVIGGHSGLTTIMLAALTVINVGFFGATLLMSRAEKREAAAGYTTLNRVHLDREQRHPVTGVVVRAANQPPLSKEDFRELVRR